MQTWRKLFEFLRSTPPGTLVSWEEAALVAGSPIKTSRGALARANQELGTIGLTVTGQSPSGFIVASTREV